MGTYNLLFTAQTIHSSIRFLSPKKAFTPSHGVCFHLIFKGFKCEGLIFQAFTPQGALGQLFLLIAKGFPV